MRLIDADKLEVVGISVPDGMDADSFAAGAQAVYKRLGLTLDFGDPENLVDFNDD